MNFTDQLHQTITLENYPKRIVSIVPSQSELIWGLGMRDELVGITKFCIHPSEMYDNITHIGGTKNLAIEKIKNLHPDIIIGNKEENDKEQIETLQKYFPVWMSDIFTVSDSLEMIKGIGQLVNKENESLGIIKSINDSSNTLPQINKRALYFIWNNPYMVAGKNTFIGDILKKLGLVNCIDSNDSRYPTLTIEEIVNLNPEVILLSSEPFPFKEVHINVLQKNLPNTKIFIVDGEAFSWYGNRLMNSSHEFNKLAKILA